MDKCIKMIQWVLVVFKWALKAPTGKAKIFFRKQLEVPFSKQTLQGHS